MVIGTGGFASAFVLKLQIICSSHSGTRAKFIPRITNKLLVKKSYLLLMKIRTFFPKEKMVLTGNPVQDLIDIDGKREQAISFFKLDPNKKTLLLGGPWCKKINQLIEKNKTYKVKMFKFCNVESYYEEYKKYI
jgi:UDP-N-acetylglucosamine--N-acetylmuramyl-(pentapeptide) pyrophosphoryl-undecaprenol N-acetylglucosamine transferase